MTPTSTTILSIIIALSGATTATRAPGATNVRAMRAEDVWARTLATYAALESYADTGEVDIAYGSAASPSHDHRTFRTFFRRKPRGFFFEFFKDTPTPTVVLWVDPDAVHEWTSNSGYETTYDKAHETSPFSLDSYPTSGTVSMIPALLYTRARMVATTTEFGDPQDAGMESMNGRPCHKITGVAKSTYAATGREVNVRKVTIWIDAQTYMILRVFESWRPVTAGSVSTQTTTFHPHPNPRLEDSRFAYTVPETQQ